MSVSATITRALSGPIQPPKGVGMNLRLSYLPALRQGPPQVAFWEVIAENLLGNPRALRQVAALRRDVPISLHCVGMNLAGTDPLDMDYLAQIEALIDALEPFQVSDHLCWQRHGGVSHHDLLPFALTQANADRVSSRIAATQEVLERPIAVENLSYYVEFKASDRGEQEILAQVAAQTGCGVLLDLNNIEVNAFNLGHDPSLYLHEGLLEHVVEVHVAGPEKNGELLVDTHGGLPSDFQRRALQTLPQLRDLPICYERDNKIPPLQESYREVQRLQTLLDTTREAA